MWTGRREEAIRYGWPDAILAEAYDYQSVVWSICQRYHKSALGRTLWHELLAGGMDLSRTNDLQEWARRGREMRSRQHQHPYGEQH